MNRTATAIAVVICGFAVLIIALVIASLKKLDSDEGTYNIILTRIAFTK